MVNKQEIEKAIEYLKAAQCVGQDFSVAISALDQSKHILFYIDEDGSAHAHRTLNINGVYKELEENMNKFEKETERNLLEQCVEEIENLYEREIELSKKVRDFLDN